MNVLPIQITTGWLARYAFAWAGLFLTAFAATPSQNVPTLFDSRFAEITKWLDAPHSGIQLELSTIASSTFIDPPPDRLTWDKYRAVSVTLQGDHFRERASKLLEELRQKQWVKANDLSGYSRVRLMVYGKGGVVLMELYLRAKESALRFDDAWYRVDSAVLGKFLYEFRKMSAEE